MEPMAQGHSAGDRVPKAVLQRRQMEAGQVMSGARSQGLRHTIKLNTHDIVC